MTPEIVDTTEPVRQEKRTDELGVGDAVEYGAAIRFITHTQPVGADVLVVLDDGNATRRPAELRWQVPTEEEIEGARVASDRHRTLNDIAAWVEWMRAHPDAPAPAYPVEQIDLYDADGAEKVRELAVRYGRAVTTTNTSVKVDFKFGSFEYRIIAWYTGR